MGLRWNKTQKEIYDMLQQGLKPKVVEAKGKPYTAALVKKVQKAIARGDSPPGGSGGEGNQPKGEPPLFSATLRTKGMTLDPMVAVRYDSVRNALGWGDDYRLEDFIDDCTDLVTQLVGAVPPGFVKEVEEEKPTEAVAVGAGQENKGGDNGGNQ